MSLSAKLAVFSALPPDEKRTFLLEEMRGKLMYGPRPGVLVGMGVNSISEVDSVPYLDGLVVQHTEDEEVAIAVHAEGYSEADAVMWRDWAFLWPFRPAVFVCGAEEFLEEEVEDLNQTFAPHIAAGLIRVGTNGIYRLDPPVGVAVPVAVLVLPQTLCSN